MSSPGGQTGGNLSELESESILLGLPLCLADSQIRPAWSPRDGVRCSCGVIVGSFQIPCRRTERRKKEDRTEDKNGKRVKISAQKKSFQHKSAQINEPHIKLTSFFLFHWPFISFLSPKSLHGSRSLRYIGGDLAEDLSRQLQFQLGTKRNCGSRSGTLPNPLGPQTWECEGGGALQRTVAMVTSSSRITAPLS